MHRNLKKKKNLMYEKINIVSGQETTISGSASSPIYIVLKGRKYNLYQDIIMHNDNVNSRKT